MTPVDEAHADFDGDEGDRDRGEEFEGAPERKATRRVAIVVRVLLAELLEVGAGDRLTGRDRAGWAGPP